MKASVYAMPFKSAKQRRYLHMIEPELAKRWEEEYGSGVKMPKSTKSQKPVATAKKKTTKKQGYNDRLDESLGKKNGKESTKKSKKDRRDESKGAEKAAGKPAYSGNKSSNQGPKKKAPAKKKKKK